MSTIDVAIIEPVGGHGGMDYYDYGLIDGLLQSGVRVHLYTCNETQPLLGLDDITFKFFHKIYGKEPKILRAMRYIFGFVKSVIHARLRSIKVCHLHFFHYTLIDLLGVLIARIFLMTVVSTIHDVESFAKGEGSFFAKLVFRLSRILIVHNDSSYRCLALTVPGSDKIRIIPHGNYLPFIGESVAKDRARSLLSLSPEICIVLFFGQIKHVKGLDVLLEAWSFAQSNLPAGAKLVIAGKVWKDGWERYANIIHSNNIESSVVTEIRFIEDERARMYYSAADLVVLPYRRIYQSGVLLMAMSYGCPVVASNIPGMTDTIRDGINGMLFETENPHDLARVIVAAFSDRPNLDRLARDGKIWVEDNLNWHRIAKMTQEAYACNI